MFRQLCGENGPDAMACVALVTTFWGGEKKEIGDGRERQLETSSNFWSQIIAKGGKVFRHDQGVASGAKIISYLVGRKERMTLEIQRDMVDRGMKLEETGAGKVVQEELNRIKAEHARELKRIRDEWKEALTMKDEEWQNEIKAYKAEIEKKMQDDRIQREKLRQNDAELRRQIEEEREKERQKFKIEITETEKKIKEYQDAIEKSQKLDQEVMRDLKKEIERQKELAAQYRRSARESKCMVM
jgi:chromosome segregation ATPase